MDIKTLIKAFAIKRCNYLGMFVQSFNKNNSGSNFSMLLIKKTNKKLTDKLNKNTKSVSQQ